MKPEGNPAWVCMGWVIKFCNKHSSAACIAVHFGNAETGGGDSILNSPVEALNFELSRKTNPPRARPPWLSCWIFLHFSINRANSRRMDGERSEDFAGRRARVEFLFVIVLIKRKEK